MAEASDDVSVEYKDTVVSAFSSPESVDTKEGVPDQGNFDENQSGSKLPKVWEDDETKCLISLYKLHCSKLKHPSYTKKNLWRDISIEMSKMGYQKSAILVGKRWYALKAAYRRSMSYKIHQREKKFPYYNDLKGLHNSDSWNINPQQPPMNSSSLFVKAVARKSMHRFGNSLGTSIFHQPQKKVCIDVSSIEHDNFDDSAVPPLEPIRNYTHTQIKKQPGNSFSKIQSDKMVMMYQCGLCGEKFTSSQHLHSHACIAASTDAANLKLESEYQKILDSSQESVPRTFHWNSMITMKLLDCLKKLWKENRIRYAEGANIWDDIAMILNEQDHPVTPNQVHEKWKILSKSFIKTINYNKLHKEKKKCAFFNRLSELQELGVSFKGNEWGHNLTSISASMPSIHYNGMYLNHTTVSNRFMNGGNVQEAISKQIGQNGENSRELIAWLDNFREEWKDLERRRDEAQQQRHSEIMEVLSCVAESMVKYEMPMQNEWNIS